MERSAVRVAIPAASHCQKLPVLLPLLSMMLLLSPTMINAFSLSRRLFWKEAVACTSLVAFPQSSKSDTQSAAALATASLLNNYEYSDSWTGTALPLMDISQATSSSQAKWKMAKWPDPVLRRPAAPVDNVWFGTDSLLRMTELLQETCRKANAVGLAAQQCGVNARIVYLEPRMSMINPRIVNRSSELEMKVWRENCLVLPPSVVATVLRDAWIDVEYSDWKGNVHKTRLRGELARAAQHEMDHDRGILILDHMGLDELENANMRAIERKGHEERMELAYARAIEKESYRSQAV